MNFDRIKNVLGRDKVVTPRIEGQIFFVGDTHGDYSTTRFLIDKFLNPPDVMVFLGDYVDRGPDSKRNIDFLLSTKIEYPENIFLLQGNHEGFKYQSFRPADFWDSLNSKSKREYQETLALLPWVFSSGSVIALHGGLPNMENMDAIRKIRPGSEEWRKITWGDFVSRPGFSSGTGFGRPQLAQDYFELVMDKLNKKILIRSHQPNAPLFMYDNRCITVFTSSAYGTKKRIVKVPGDVENIEDVEIIEP